MTGITLRLGLAAILAISSAVVQAEGPPTFGSLAEPFLERYCLDCHDSDTRKGDLALDELTGVSSGNAELWKRIWEQVALKEMPPRKKKQPEAMERLMRIHAPRDILFIESGGDNLAATFSPELVDASIYVIAVSAGDKIRRKGGPGITRSDLLLINKIDLAPMVGASLEIMQRDAKKMRGERPFIFSNLKTDEGLDRVIRWIKSELLFVEA